MQNDTLHLISGTYTSVLWERLEEILTGEDSPECIFRVLKALHDYEDSDKVAFVFVKTLYDFAGIEMPSVAKDLSKSDDSREAYITQLLEDIENIL